MKIKYYRYTLQGEFSAEDAQRELSDAGSQGLIVRLDNVGGQTHVYVASEGESIAKSTAKKTATRGIQAEEVSEKDVTKISRK